MVRDMALHDLGGSGRGLVGVRADGATQDGATPRIDRGQRPRSSLMEFAPSTVMS